MTLTHGTHRRSQVDMMAPRLERANRRVRAQAENQVPESHASMAEARNGKRSKFKLSSSHNKLTKISAKLLLLALQIFIFILVIASATRRVNCLKVTVSIPELVKLNDAFWLNCSHDTPPKSLAAFASYVNHQQELARELRFRDIYSISWYKDDTEFYRFEPSARVAGDYAKVGKFWPTSGVQPDKSKSIEGNVYLTKADVMSEGTYRCEIVAELSFETVRKSKHLKVFALPVRGPRIEILDANGRPKNPKEQEISYEVGDKIVLRCNSNPSKPAARLRWYLNDREVLVPNSQATNNLADRQAQGISSGRYAAANQQQQPPLGYNVQVTPIEYRNHYKGIYSSHSNLSVVLERDDLVNSRISFKCLASMRQEVTVASKQLIMLTPQAGLALDGSQQRAKRSPADQPRHRVQYNQMRQPQVTPYYRKGAQILSEKASRILNESRLMMELNNNNTAALDDPRQQMMYIYEDSDTTLGPSIVDNPGTLGAYLSELAAAANSNNNSGSSDRLNNNNVVGTGPSAVSFNRADNLEYMQIMRERSQQQHRQRSSVPNSGANLGTTSGHRRLYGPSAVVKSPFYLDENDPFRPVINWPPLDSGKLMLLPGGAQTIVAIPSHSGSYQYASGGDANANELRFITPPRGEAAASDSSSAFPDAEPPQTTPENTSRMILDRLIDNLNCTCTEGSLDTKLGWIVNEHSLTSSRDVRLYPTRVSPDHRQTWISIGLQAGQHQAAGGSLASILSQYYKLVEAQARVMNGPNGQLAAALRSRPSSSGTVGVGGGGGGTNSGQQVSPVGNEQLKFMCQAEHSMLLYSSSEMITFDFGGTPPPPPLTPSQSSSPTNNNEIDNTNSIVDKLSSSSSSSRATTSPFNIHLAICSNGCEHMILLLLLFCWHCCLSSRYFRAGLR